MKVIILAAGIGQRLGDLCKNRPKCLLEFGGQTLLRRHLTYLKPFPVTEIAVVTGFQQAMIVDELDKAQPQVPVRTVYNPDFTLGSVLSLWHARDVLNAGSDVILMDADVLYDPRIIRVLFHSDSPNCMLLDRDFEPGDEPVKICVRDGVPIDFRKRIDKDLQFDLQGESVGFFRLAATTARRLAGILQGYIDTKRLDEPYEEALRDLLLVDQGAFRIEDITGMPWIEIDFPEDIERAGNQILNEIEELNR